MLISDYSCEESLYCVIDLILVSSANMYSDELRACSGRNVIYINQKDKGYVLYRTLPCGTPDITGSSGEEVSLKCT